MRSSLATTALAAALASTSHAQMMFNAEVSTSNASTPDCPAPGGAHIIVARASLEAPGFGIIGVVKDKLLAAVPGSTAEFVTYPATLNDYLNSETAGVVAMRKLITEWEANCPCGPLVVMGYSQGAQVSADSLVGQNVNGFPDNSSVDTPLSSSILSRTAGVILMGDPSLVVNASFHVGNSTKTSIFPRHNNQNFDLQGLGSRTQSYCDAGDPYCATGGELIVHLGYVGEYGQQATDFVVNNIKDFYAKQGSSCAASNGTASGVAPTGTAPSTRKPSASGTAPSTRTATGSRVVVAPTGTGYAAPTGTGAAKPSSSGLPPGAVANAASSQAAGLVAVVMGGVLAFML